MFTKQFKLTLATIFAFVFVFGLLAHISILTMRVKSLENTTQTIRITTVNPTQVPSVTVTATPSAGLRSTVKTTVSPTKKIVAPVSTTPSI